ncbi:hypothetical protein SAMN05421766_104503 [Zobellia uliginosa]|uniref:DUF3575 domain-containing protein n=1 Tax=Zobellia uliginosa TaxID=143224 RepID=A0ABY1L085_9FLAO|nr:hypothetical protein [Zobellia uliginosa]SIS86859.1 hypothetical protein SAMN05421766_104503 [Zobellia uliginosa]
MKTINIVVVFFVFTIFANAQHQKNVENHQIQLGLPMPAILYEKGLGRNTTATVEFVSGFGLRGCTGCETEFGIYPILRGQFRYYYNMDRRLDKGKNISGNSGNYIAVLMAYQDQNPFIGDLTLSESILAVGPVYGIQRTYKRGFFYRLEGGLGYSETQNENGLALLLAARVGWAFGKRR